MYRGINECKKDYQPRTLIVKDEKGIWLQTPAVFWLGGGTFSSTTVYTGVNDVRQTELHTGEPLVSEPNVFEFQLAIEKLKSHKSLSID